MSELSNLLARCERAVAELPQPYFGATPEDEIEPQPGPRQTGWTTTLEVHPGQYVDITDASTIGSELKALAERQGAQFQAENGVFFLRKPPPEK